MSKKLEIFKNRQKMMVFPYFPLSDTVIEGVFRGFWGFDPPSSAVYIDSPPRSKKSKKDFAIF